MAVQGRRISSEGLASLITGPTLLLDRGVCRCATSSVEHPSLINLQGAAGLISLSTIVGVIILFCYILATIIGFAAFATGVQKAALVQPLH